MQRISDALDRKWLSNHGPLVNEFEEAAKEFLGVKHAIATCNATIGLEVLAGCLEIKGEVIMPAWTFVASAHAFTRMGATPIFCDIDPRTHCLDPWMVEQLIGPRTEAILGVHLWGTPCCPIELERIALQHGIPLLFDAAHAIGCSHKGQKIGSFGQAEVFSLHATKALNAFEGGLITTNDDILAHKLREASNFGFSGYDRVCGLGTNAKMHEASAAMGLTSLEGREQIFRTNQHNLERYAKNLSHLPGIKILLPETKEESNFHYVVLEIDKFKCGLSRDTMAELLIAEGIMARRYFFPAVHRMEPYLSRRDRHSPNPLPQTEKLSATVLALPNGLSVSDTQIDRICETILDAVAAGEQIERTLSKLKSTEDGLKRSLYPDPNTRRTYSL